MLLEKKISREKFYITVSQKPLAPTLKQENNLKEKFWRQKTTIMVKYSVEYMDHIF